MDHPPVYNPLALRSWAEALRFPFTLVESITRLPTMTPVEVDELADGFVDQGYPWTANEIRRRWKP